MGLERKILKGTIYNNAEQEDMAKHMETLNASQCGTANLTSGCAQRGWIINGCYWCGTDCCVNPGWLMATCHHCGGSFIVTR